MDYFLKKGMKKLTFNPSDFKAGGEAKVYIEDKTVYKIFHESKNMIPHSKIAELQRLKIKNICIPREIIIDSNKDECGFTMDLVVGDPLFQLCTNTFIKNHNIKGSNIIDLGKSMIKTIFKIHPEGCLIVDLNDLNVLAEHDWKTPHFIDINSWKTPSFPFTAINPLFRDWTIDLKDVSEKSDWYSFAIILFKMIIGAHPYKGDHPKYKREETIKRMQDGVSRFNKDSTPAPGSRDLSLIPIEYKKWFIDLFEEGKRYEPPSESGEVVAVVKTAIVTTTGKYFDFTLLKEYEEDVLSHKGYYDNNITRTSKRLFINNTDYRVNHGVDVIFTNSLEPIFVKIEEATISFKKMSGTINFPKLFCEKYLIIENDVYIVHDGKLIGLSVASQTSSSFSLITIRNTWDIMRTSLQVFDTMLYQSISGKPYLVIPLPKDGATGSCIQKEIPELDGYKIVDAKHDNNVVMIIGYKDNVYNHISIRFDKIYDKYKTRITKDVTMPLVNFVVLDNGIVVSMIDDITEIFQKDLSQSKVNRLKDDAVNASMRLCKKDIEIRVYIDNRLFKMATKQKKG